MANSKYRQAMLQAFSFPVALFVVFPFSLILIFSFLNFGDAVGVLFTAAAVLVPLYLTGLLLAPWAGRRIETTKAPAFFMAAASALSPAVVLSTVAALSGDISQSFLIAGIFSFFGLPASLLGALLFIGACERLHESAPAEQM